MAVYLAAPADRTIVKIGFTDRIGLMGWRLGQMHRVARRVARAEFGPFACIGVWPLATLQDEAVILAYFEREHIGREYFHPAPAILDYAASMYPWMPGGEALASWADYAAAVQHPPLCADWLQEERGLPLRARLVCSQAAA